MAQPVVIPRPRMWLSVSCPCDSIKSMNASTNGPEQSGDVTPDVPLARAAPDAGGRAPGGIPRSGADDGRPVPGGSEHVDGKPEATPFPGFRAVDEPRRRVIASLVRARHDEELTQTVVAARMGTSQSVVARLESGDNDVRLSTLERYAAAVGRRLDWEVGES